MRPRLALFAMAVLGVASIPLAGLAAPAPQANEHAAAAVCGPSVSGFARCHSRVQVDPSGAPQANITPSGYGPASLRSAYQVPDLAPGTTRTVAIVDAHARPNAEAAPA